MNESKKREIIEYYTLSMSYEQTSKHTGVTYMTVKRVIRTYEQFGETFFTDHPIPVWMQKELADAYKLTKDINRAADKVNCNRRVAEFVLSEILKVA